MGNRAVITTKDKEIAVYLHWNGGRDSVEAFLKYCEICDFRPPEKDNYGWARLCQVIANFFGAGGLSIGIDTYENLETSADWDNGVYIIKDWKVIGRERFKGIEQNVYNLEEALASINEQQPDEMKKCFLETITKEKGQIA